jgi:hypothetical protein
MTAVSLRLSSVRRHTVAEQGGGSMSPVFGAREAKWFFGFIVAMIVIKYLAGHM